MVSHKKKKKTIESITADIAKVEAALESHAKDVENYRVQTDLELELHRMKLVPGANERIRPEFTVEKNPRYWELQTLLLAYKFREREAIIKGEFDRYEYERETLTLSIENLKVDLARLESK